MSALPLTISMVRLAPDFAGTPQEIADAIAAGLTITAQQQFALFVSGSTEPDTDLGPWAKDGNSWYYFDAEEGAYVPFFVPTSRLGYVIQVDEPTDDQVNIWYEIDNAGTPVDIQFRAPGSAGAFASPFYRKSETYTQAEVNAAIAAALQSQSRYAVRAQSAGSQTVGIDGTGATPQKLLFTNQIFDPDNVYEAGDSRYTAPVSGIYRVSLLGQFDNVSGDATDMQITVYVSRGTAVAGANALGHTVAVASPPGSRWFPTFSGLVFLNEDEFMEVAFLATDGVNAGDLSFSNAVWSIDLVQQTS